MVRETYGHQQHAGEARRARRRETAAAVGGRHLYIPSFKKGCCKGETQRQCNYNR